jgi:hypothetical protein
MFTTGQIVGLVCLLVVLGVVTWGLKRLEARLDTRFDYGKAPAQTADEDPDVGASTAPPL